MAIARPSHGVCTSADGCNTSMSPDTAVDGLTAGYGGWLYGSGGLMLNITTDTHCSIDE